MKKIKPIVGLVLFALLVSSAAEAQWVFLARKGMGKIRQMQSDNADVAAVIIEAKADDVYAKALSTVQGKGNLQILGKDDAERTLGFTDGERKVKMKVSELGDKVSEILITAAPAPGKESTSSIVVEKIMEVCRAVKTECHLSK